MSIHYSEDYHRAITCAGETSVTARWGWARERIQEYKRGGAILDIGCSSGTFLRTMQHAAWKLYGIEREASTAQRAQEATGANVFVGDALAAPFPPGNFDVITSFDLLEHVYQPREFLAKIHSWLKPGGIYFVALPNIDSWEARIFGTYWYGLELPRHLTHFSLRSLRHVMNVVGFHELSLTTTSVSYIDNSINYLYIKFLTVLGLSPRSAAKVHTHSVIYRAARKMAQLGLIAPFGILAARAQAGASMVGVFRK
jgi:2-polyprenyl-3-methyl-5-hydroxy-6-metoxy-1,4-benzoquinol methylase